MKRPKRNETTENSFSFLEKKIHTQNSNLSTDWKHTIHHFLLPIFGKNLNFSHRIQYFGTLQV